MADKIRVLVNGAKGKMGSETVRAVQAEDDLELVGEIDVDDELDTAIYDTKPRVVVDFTHPDSGVQNTGTILECGASPVVGTTGFKPKDIDKLDHLAHVKHLGGLVAPNFAIGAVLMMRFAAEAAKYMPHAEIIELHHDRKADAPSGTAIKTAELMQAAIAEANSEKPGTSTVQEKVLLEGARGGTHESGYRIHSVRLPGLVANQQVIFGAPGQTLTIQHETIDRTCFMPGVLLSIRQVLDYTGMVYGLDKLLFGED